jgi:hypothetical protein
MYQTHNTIISESTVASGKSHRGIAAWSSGAPLARVQFTLTADSPKPPVLSLKEFDDHQLMAMDPTSGNHQ